MEITAAFKENILTMKFMGELDHHAAKKAMSDIEDIIDRRPFRDCVIDLERLSFMDSSGIAVILKAYRWVSQVGGRLCVENVAPQPMKVLDASGIERLIKITSLVKE